MEVVDKSEGDLVRDQFQDPQWGGQQLRKIAIFGGMTLDELTSLYRLGEIRRVSAKAHAVIEGEHTRGLFILLQGTVSVYKTDPSNNNMIRLAFLEQGAAFGELSLFDDAPRSATVVAEIQCFLFYLDVSAFNNFLDQNGDNTKTRFYKKCAEDMVERFRKQNGDYITAQKLLWQYALRRQEGAEKAAGEGKPLPPDASAASN